MWDLPRSGTEPVSPALADEFFTAEPPDLGIEPVSPALADEFFTAEPPGKPKGSPAIPFCSGGGAGTQG